MQELFKQYLDRDISRGTLLKGLSAVGMSAVAASALAESLAERDAATATECFRLADAWSARWRRNRNAGFDARSRAIAATHLLGHALQPRAADPTAASRSLLERADALVSA